MIVRKMVEIPNRDSFFLLGPRQTGKSTLIRHWLKKKKFFEIDLLNTQLYFKYSTHPQQLHADLTYQIEENSIKHIFIDEIQKIPELLNVVHSLIEKYKVQFILTGSSAKKLKKLHANLLGGRAIVLKLFPLIYAEINDQYEFEEILKYGTLTGLFSDSEKIKQKKLNAYVETYLKEEISQEGFIRNLPVFSRFLKLAGQTFSQLINFENVSRESGINAKTVAAYYQILEDTLIGYYLPCWDRSVRKQLSKHSKFYFFDNGVTTTLNDSLTHKLSPELQGANFEQLMINEIRAVLHYTFSELQLHFWRTQAGNEVDLVLSRGGKPIAAIEFKNKKKLSNTDMSGLNSFSEEYPDVKNIFCIADIDLPYKLKNIKCLPWEVFLKTELLKLVKL